MKGEELPIVISAKDNATTTLKKVQSELRTTTNEAGDNFANARKKAEEFSDGLKKVSLVTGVAGAALTVYAKSATDHVVGMAADAKNLARLTGSTVEESSKLIAVTTRMGVSAQEASSVFGIFAKRIVDTTGPLADLGIKAKAADGSTRPFNDILGEVADKFKTMPDGAQKTALSMDLFGRSGKDMIKFLNQGSDGIAKLEAEAEKLGLTLTNNNIAAIDKYVISQRKLKESNDAMKISVGTATAPVLAEFNTKLNETVQKLVSTDGAVKTITTDILAFGGPVLGGVSAITAFTANLATSGVAVAQVTTKLVAAQGGMLAMAASATPVIVAFAAVGAGSIALANYLGFQNNKTTELDNAQRNLKASSDALKVAQDTVSASNLALEGTNLRVEQSQRMYNDAVAQYGPNSFQARDANYQLKDALLAKKNAEDQAAQAVSVMKSKEIEYAKSTEMINAVRARADEVRNLNDLLNTPISKQAAPTGGNKGVVKGSSLSLIDSLQRAFSGRATGGPVKAGVPYVVGERNAEVFKPNTAGRISPTVPDGMGQVTNILSGTFNFHTEEAVDAMMSRLDKTQRLAANFGVQ